jgi:hypothetical protein
MSLRSPSRRTFVKSTALATAGTLAFPYVKTAYSAGRVTLGLWDHWVPGANDTMVELARTWGDANNVDVQIDFITSVGNQNLLTAAAEARARAGHDVLSHPTFQIAVHQSSLEPVDDVIGELESEYGEFADNAVYLARLDGAWRAVPTCAGSQSYPMNSRLDYFRDLAGIDLQDMFPAGPRDPEKTKLWTRANFLEACKKLHAGGHPFGDPIGQTSDSQDWLGPLFLSFGSMMVDAEGNITADSDETREALAYMEELVQYMPDDIYAWDDAANNRWIISGQGATIHNPPSPWTVAKRDAPEVAAQIWHHDAPAGPRGWYRGNLPYFWGLWEFSQNKSAAKDLLLHLSRRDQQAALVAASQGFDMPMIKSFDDFDTYVNAEPPAGTLYNYPVQGEEILTVAGWPAPPSIAANIYFQALIPNMIARVTVDGESHDQAIDWASRELEGFMRG